MTPDQTESGNGDLGLPVVELRELLAPPPPAMVVRVRTSIHRRLSAADSVDFGIQAFWAVMLDYLDMLMQAITGSRPAREKD